MNRIYRLAWNRALGCFVPASEVTPRRGKGTGGRSGRTIYGCKRGATGFAAAAALLLSGVDARAGPTGGQVIAGSGHITQSGTTTNIVQTSQSLSLNWATFDIASRETVNFLQPSVSAIAVNRIFDTNGTQILGRLNANGQVYLINPNGILFGRGAQINVGGLVASTLDVSDAALNGDTKSFSGSGSGSVLNDGAITAVNGGSVVLLGNRVGNNGVINAEMGTVALGAGRAATLTFNGNTLVHMQIDQSVLDSVAKNGGLLHADGGRVIMSAGAKDALLASVVNNTGVIEARTVDNQGGVITLSGGMAAGTVHLGGMLDASAPNGGHGGAVETSAAHVEIADDAEVNTSSSTGRYGSWLIDPHNFTVAASGGDISGTVLSNNLATTAVILRSSAGGAPGSGDVNVNDAVSWGANTILTLTASNNVNVNATITAIGNTAGLVINPNTANGTEAASGTGTFNLNNSASINLSGSTPSLSIAGSAYVVINKLGAAGSTTGTDLQGTNGNLTAHYALGSNIDASATSGWNGGGGFTPIGTLGTPFTGNFNGLGHTISNLTINLTTPNVGLFGYTGTGAAIADVGLIGGSVTGGAGTGGLVGNNGPGNPIDNSYTTANVSGAAGTGGLVGTNTTGAISNSYATGSVNGAAGTGGLVGTNTTGAISSSYATGSANGAAGTGGLIGSSTSGMISNSYATGSVSGAAGTGGLIGSNTSGPISNSYATGSVNGGTGAGVGGLIGSNTSGTVANSYSAGSVSGSGASVGALIGSSDAGVVTNSYWDKTTSSVQSSAGGGLGMTTALMMTRANFISATSANSPDNPAWDFANTWTIYEGHTYPLLSRFMTPLMVTANDATKTYGQASPEFSVSYSTAPSGNLLGTVSYGGTSQTAANTGNYAITPFGLYSNQQGYSILYRDGALTITPATLLVTASAASRLYGAAEPVFSGSVTGFVAGDTQSSATAGPESFSANALPHSNVGRYSITGSGLTANNGNYVFVQAASNATALTINPTALTVTGSSASNKVYDGALTGAVTAGTLVGAVSGDTVTLNESGSFVSKNVGSGIVVTATDSLSGASAGNYTLIQPIGLAANITPASLTVTGESAGNKVYDGAFTAMLAGGTLSAAIAGDTVTLNESGSFVSKNVGSGIVVTATDSLGGASASNYTLIQPIGLAANITPASLTVTGESAGNKVYDGAFTAPLSGGTLSGVISGDTVTLALTEAGNFISKNVGTAISVTATDSLSGASAGNYTLIQPIGLAANITPASLTLTGESAGNKVYDGAFTAPLSGGTLSAAIAGDTVTLNESGSFVSKNVGSGIVVTATDNLGGASASNYTLIQPIGLAANITPASLTVAGESAGNKVYDGAFTAPLSGGTLSGVISGDTVTLALTEAGNFISKNVGTSIIVTATDSLSGASAGNYTLIQPIGLSANITPASLTVTGESAGNKVYDGAFTAPLSGGSLRGVVAGDTATLALNQAGVFASKNVGTAISVMTADSLSGASAGNYTLIQPIGLAANITPASLTVTGESAGNKVYDGAFTAPLSGGTLSGVISGDAVTLALTEAGNFISKNVGTAISVTATDSLSGASAGNYTLIQPIGLAANITPASLTVTGESAGNKVYDGAFTALLSGGSLRGVVAGDTATLALNQAGVFASKNVGTSIIVTATDSLSGASAGNYTLTEPTVLAGNISPAALTVTGTSTSDKVYDGAFIASLTGGTLSAAIAGDTVTLTESGHFVSKNVGNAIVVIVSDSLAGASAGNYTLSESTGLAANITPATLTVAGSIASNKVYDGTFTVALSGGSLRGVVAGDAATLSLNQTGTFASKNVGTAIAVTATDSLAGASAGNYALTRPNVVAADITPATLTYLAAPTSLTIRGTPSGLSGTLSGFVQDDTQDNAASGTLTWTTAAGATSPLGLYAIVGEGLNAMNYVFVQAPGNATALLVMPTVSTAPIPNVLMQVDSSFPSSRSDSDCEVDTRKTRTSALPALYIVNGGVKLPANIVNFNE